MHDANAGWDDGHLWTDADAAVFFRVDKDADIKAAIDSIVAVGCPCVDLGNGRRRFDPTRTRSWAALGGAQLATNRRALLARAKPSRRPSGARLEQP